jgi:diguanylate cyclase (GGDEF)-like protein/PAS domain S-box-containing protein
MTESGTAAVAATSTKSPAALPDEIVLIREVDGTVRYISPSAEAILGYALEDVRQRLGVLLPLVHPDDVPAERQFAADLLSQPGASIGVRLRLRHADGDYRSVEVVGINLLTDSSIEGILVTYRDLTAREQVEARLVYQASHDALTDLPNRGSFLNRLKQAVAQPDNAVAVLFTDLDRFKLVNDSFGHEAGDWVLMEAAERLRQVAPPDGMVARFGGDEFMLMIDHIAGAAAAGALAERVVSALTMPFEVHGQELYIGASVGISMTRPGQRDPAGLLREADTAMYRAKGLHVHHAIFDQAMHAVVLSRLEMETDLRRALARDEFLLHYQPLVDLVSGRLAAVEALVRWHHPTRGVLHPDQFVPLAEESGLLRQIDRWVVREACRQAQSWHERLPIVPPLILSVNISARDFTHPELPADVAEFVASSGIDPGTLQLEIVEGVMIDDPDLAISTLYRLKELGVRLAIDDFGTGYSSLSYLERFPVDMLKLDRTFVRKLDGTARDLALLRAVVTVAHTLGLDVIAEGIESAKQVETLREMSCDLGQGYYFGRPVAAGEIETQLIAATSEPLEPTGSAASGGSGA